MLQVNKSLTHLDLSGNETFSDSGPCCIFEDLQRNTALLKLNLSDTNITATNPETSRSLTKMLQVNKSLTHLDLSYNSLESGARCIFEGLQHNTALLNLNLSTTDITATDPDTKRYLTKMLQVNKSLTHLDLSMNKTLSDSGARCIFEGLQHNTALVNLNLSETGITATDPDTAMSLTKMLQVNTFLTHLDLSWNETFLESGARCIYEGLQHNNSALVDLNLSNAGIKVTDPDIAQSLYKMLHEKQITWHVNVAYSCGVPHEESIQIFFGHLTSFSGINCPTIMLHVSL